MRLTTQFSDCTECLQNQSESAAHTSNKPKFIVVILHEMLSLAGTDSHSRSLCARKTEEAKRKKTSENEEKNDEGECEKETFWLDAGRK